jgi:peptidoglycan-associated lipoprotein
MYKLVLSAFVLSLMAGCAGRDVKPTTPPAKVEDRGVIQPAPEDKTAETKPLEQRAIGAEALKDPRLKDPKNPLSRRVIYYDYDMANIKDEFRPIIQAHAKFMQEHPQLRMTVQGHTDERGSREYNIALGQRRADSVKRALGVLGVGENRLETVSFGEEKPAAQGSNESAWAQNRRSVIVYQGE